MSKTTHLEIPEAAPDLEADVFLVEEGYPALARIIAAARRAKVDERCIDLTTEANMDLGQQNYRLRQRVEELEEVLREIAKGEGRFDTDHHMHAANTIEDMKELATKGLAG